MASTRGPGRVAAVIPARNEQERIGATVRAVRALPHVDLVVVVDDGSATDSGVARAAGPRVPACPKQGQRRGHGDRCEGVRGYEATSGGPALTWPPAPAVRGRRPWGDRWRAAALIEPVCAGKRT